MKCAGRERVPDAGVFECDACDENSWSDKATQQKVDFTKFFTLLRPRGTMCFVGMCPPISADVFTMGFTMHNITTSNTGGRKEMVEMLEFCARNKIGARVVERPLAKVNEVLAELESSKGAQRFVLTA